MQKIPQQNGVVERKNRVVQEMARVMLHSKNIPQHFGLKLLTLLSMFLIVFILDPELKPPHMRYGLKSSQI